METLTLRAIRINLGWSLEQASKRLGVSKDTLSNYERGITLPDVFVLKRIENVYQISYDRINFLVQNTEQIGKVNRQGG